tara:strand:- start:15727 stop:15987 length:261 start_codon:yes stop_codon:yes gene_type:complete
MGVATTRQGSRTIQGAPCHQIAEQVRYPALLGAIIETCVAFDLMLLHTSSSAKPLDPRKGSFDPRDGHVEVCVSRPKILIFGSVHQ